MKFNTTDETGISKNFYAASWEEAEKTCKDRGWSINNLGIVLEEISASDIFKNISALTQEIKVKHYGKN